ncbi:MAG: pantoate--beta-alanine ligase [Alphaproteobacteria bacterium]
MSGELVILRHVSALRERVKEWRKSGQTVALIPTMGALHEGHLTLVRQAKTGCDRTIATIFVNPKQFGPNEDFGRYPRDEAGDARLLAGVKTDVLFAPAVDEMYPGGFSTHVHVAGVSEGLCGAHRPGHFDGVATVVSKLLLQALPDAAFFGEKDYQQLCVIRRMVRDLDIPVRIVGVPTVREADGLAMSSRNRYLGPDQRVRASALSQVLRDMARQAEAGIDLRLVAAWGKEELERARFDRVEYVEIRDAESLAPVPGPVCALRILAAVWLGNTRLIDNVPVAAPA